MSIFVLLPSFGAPSIPEYRCSHAAHRLRGGQGAKALTLSALTYALLIGSNGRVRSPHWPSIEHRAETLQQGALWFIEPLNENVRGTMVAQTPTSVAAMFIKIRGLRCSPCLDIAGVTGSIPVAPTINQGLSRQRCQLPKHASSMMGVCVASKTRSMCGE